MSTDLEDPSPRPFPDSLCHRCAHNRVVGNRRGSVFLMCRELPNKYPVQPVLRCIGFSPRPEGP